MDTIWIPDLTAWPGPKYQALAAALTAAVESGVLPPGARLPTVRDLAWQLKITPGTVARAYALTTRSGVTEAAVGRGTFVSEAADRRLYGGSDAALSFMLPPAGPPLPEAAEGIPVDLRALRLPELGQSRHLARAMLQAAARLSPVTLDYPAAGSDLALREAVCDWLGEEIEGVGPEDLVLTSGGQQALGLVMAAVLNGPRPLVLTEDLAYPGLRHAARLYRAEVQGVEMDGQGLLPEALEQICRRQRPQLLCMTAEGQNPTAARMGLERRQQIVAIARAYNLTLIEDNCYGVPVPGLPGMRRLAPERCYLVGSFSKSLAPALRLGWLVAPSGQAGLAGLVMRHSQFAVSGLLGEICLELLRSGDAARIREALRQETATRLETLVNMLGSFDLGWQPGLAFCWLRLPLGWRASAFTRAAEAEGVLVRPADEFALLHGRAPHAVRLTLGGNCSRPSFEAALGRLLQLLSMPPHELSV